jgi:hypothetical protein
MHNESTRGGAYRARIPPAPGDRHLARPKHARRRGRSRAVPAAYLLPSTSWAHGMSDSRAQVVTSMSAADIQRNGLTPLHRTQAASLLATALFFVSIQAVFSCFTPDQCAFDSKSVLLMLVPCCLATGERRSCSDRRCHYCRPERQEAGVISSMGGGQDA